eukprot:jgi/Ulvmu1/4995/UM021_0012.1
MQQNAEQPQGIGLRRAAWTSPDTEHTEFDLQIMTAILKYAEDKVSCGNEKPANVSLKLLLQAYDAILRRNGIVPEEDTRYYRFLLKLSLEPYPSWWEKLQAAQLECLGRTSPVSRSLPCAQPLMQSPHMRFNRSTSPLSPCGVHQGFSMHSVQGSRPPAYTGGEFSPVDCDEATENVSSVANRVLLPDEDYAAFQAHSVMSTCFRFWQQHTQVLCISRAARDTAITKWCKALAMWEAQLCCRMFQRWKRLVRALRALATEAHAWSALHRHFLHWQLINQQRNQHLNQAVAHHGRFRMSCCIAAWQEAVCESKQQAAATAHWRCRMLRQGLLTLKSAVADGGRACAAASRHASRHKQTGTLRSWCVVATAAARRTAVGIPVTRLCDMRYAAEVLSAWHSGMKAAVRMCEQCDRADAHWRRQALSAAVREWRSRVVFLGRKHERVQMALLLWSGRRRSTVYHAWHSWAARRLDMRHRLAAIVASLRHQSMSRAFYAWLDYALDRSRKAQRCRQVMLRLQHGTLARAFAAWQDRTAELSAARHTAQLWLRMAQTSSMATWFSVWTAAARDRKHLSAVEASVRQLHAHHIQLVTLASWRADVRTQQQLISLQQSALQLLTSRILSDWRVATATAIHRRERMRNALQQMAHWRLVAAFSAWHAQATALREARMSLHRAVARWNRAALAQAFQAWAERSNAMMSAREAANTAAQCIAMHTAHAAFCGWRVRAADTNRLRALCQRVVARLRAGTMARSFTSWRQASEFRRAKRNIARTAVLHLQQRVVTRALHAWVAYTTWRIQKRELVHACALRWRRQLLAAAWDEWRHDVNWQARKRAHLQAALQHWRQRQSSAAFVAWLEFCIRSKRKAALTTKAVQRLQHARLAAAWGAWAACCAEAKQQTALMMRAVAMFRNCRLGAAWAAWAEYCEHQRSKRDAASRAMAFLTHRELAAAWNRWLEYMEEMRSARRAAKWMASQMLGCAWRAWCDAVVEGDHERAADAHYQRTATAIALRKWWGAVELRRRCRAIAHRIRHRALAAAFAGWLERAMELQQKRRSGSRAVAVWAQLTQAKAFATWLWRAAEWKEKRTLLLRSVAHMQQMQLAAAWAGWQEYVVWRQRKRRLLQLAGVRMSHLQLAAAWDTWADAVADAKRMKHKSQQAVLFWKSGAMAVPFIHWKDCVATKVRMRRLVSGALVCLAHLMVARSWAQWADVVRISKKATSACHTMRQWLLRRCWNSWVALVLPVLRARVAARRALGRLKHRTAASAFARWRAWVIRREAKRKLALCAIGFWQGATLAHRWEAWRLYKLHRQAKAHGYACAEAHARGLQLRRGIAAFRERALRQRRVRAVLVYFTDGLRLRALLCWHEAAQRRRRLRNAAHAAATRWRTLLVGSAFSEWASWAAWSAAAKSKVLAALSSWRRGTLVGVWAAWREHVVRRQTKRSQMGQAVTYWSNGVAHAALQAWFEVCIALKDAEAHWRGHRLRLVLAAWSGEARAAQQRVQAAGVLLSRILHRSLWAGWNALRENQQARERLCHALRHYRNLATSAAWRRWRDAVECTHGWTIAMEQHRAMMLREALRCWRQATRGWQQKRRRVGVAVAMFTGNRTMASFSHWQAYTRRRARCRNLAQDFSKKLARASLGSLWVHWRDQTLIWQLKRIKLAKAAAHFHSNTAAAAFCMWRTAVNEAQAEKRRQAAAMHCFTNFLHRRAWNAWIDFTRWRRRKRDICTRVAARIRHTLAARAWQSWTDCVDESCASRAARQHYSHVLLREGLACLFANARTHRLLRQHIQALRQRWLRSAWNAWVALVHSTHNRAALAQEMCTRAWRRATLDVQAWCFGVLRTWASQQRESRELLAKVLYRGMAAAFSAWAVRAFRTAAARHLLAQNLTRNMHKSFVWWKLYTAEHVHHRLVAEAMAEHLRQTPRIAMVAEVVIRRLQAGPQVSAAFAAWVEHVHRRRVARQLVRMAIAQCCFSLCHRAMATWLAAVARRRRKHAIVARWQNQCQAAAFLQWRHAARNLRREQLQRRRAVLHWTSACLRSAFNEWRSRQARKRVAHAMLRVAAMHSTRTCTQLAFHRWQRGASCLQQLAATGSKVRQHSQQLLRENVVGTWIKEAEFCAHMRTIHAAAKAFYDARIGPMVLRGWLRAAQRQRYIQAVAAGCLLKIKHRTLARAFQAWCDRVVQHRGMLQRANVLVVAWRSRTTRAAFQAWLFFVPQQQRRRAAQLRAVAFWRNSCVAAAFTAWLQVLFVKTERRSAAAAAVRHWQHARVAAAFQSWISFTLESQRKHACTARAITHWRQARLWRAFLSWTQQAAALRLARARAIRALAWWRHTHSARSFAAWREGVGRQQAARAALLRAVARWRAGTLARSMQAWQTAVTRGARRRSLTAVALQHWMSRSILWSWRAWSHAVEQLSAARTMAEAIGQQKSARFQVAVLQHWSTACSRRRRHRELIEFAVHRFKHMALSTAFHCWWQRVRHQRAVMLAMMSTRLRAWRSWRAVHIEVVQARYGAAMSHHRGMLLRQAWRGFCKCANDGAGKRAQLRRAAALYSLTSVRRAWLGWTNCVWMSRAVRRMLGKHDASLKRHLLLRWLRVAQDRSRHSRAHASVHSSAACLLAASTLTAWQRVLSAVVMYRKCCLGRALCGWRARTDAKRQWRRSALLALEVMQGSCRVRCFRAWHRHVADVLLKQRTFQRKQRAVRCALAAGHELARTRRHRALQRCLRAWQGRMRRSRQAAALLDRTLWHRAGFAWERWRGYTKRRQQDRSNANVAVEFWRSETRWRVLLHWRRALQEQELRREEVLRVAHDQLRSLRRRLVLAAWWQCMMQQRRMVGKLQVAARAFLVSHARGLRLKAWLKWRQALARRAHHDWVARAALQAQQRHILETAFEAWQRFVKAMQQSCPVHSPFSSPRRASQDKRTFTGLAMASAPSTSLWNLWDSSSQGTDSDGQDIATPGRPHVRRILTFHSNKPRSKLSSSTNPVAGTKRELELPWGSYYDE